MHGSILIAEAAATGRIVLKVRISDAFYRPLPAGDGESALRLARIERPDLILIGLGLPDRPAHEVIATLRTDPGTRSIPIIALADAADREGRAAALAAGADDVLVRPLDADLLLARIRSLLRPGESGELAAAAWGTEGQALGVQFAGLAETHADFTPATPAGEIALIAAEAGIATGWKCRLQPHLRDRLAVMGREQALALPIAPGDRLPDVFVIDADLDTPQGGLKLMLQLASHAGTRNSMFCIVTADGDQAGAAMAYDLGAHDVVSRSALPDELPLRLRNLLRRKARADRTRAALETGLRLAVIDPLTGIHNRRYAMPRLAGIAAQAGQEGSDFAVMIVDIDRFKDVNDHHGHAAGDAVLVEVARRLADSLRMSDLLARIGGEEFLVALPQTSLAEAWQVAERLRRVVGDSPVRLPSGRDLRVTVSIGMSLGQTVDLRAVDVGEMIDRADLALLRAKTEGRDQVTFSHNVA